jgi:threonyl-tRNA synthetase
VQCDFNLPERFDLAYTDRDGLQKRPIMVHRAVLGSFERFTGILIEHYGGDFPLWLAPTQVALIPIREEHADYCRQAAQALGAAGLRVECHDQPGHMNKKIKQARLDRVPFLLIAGGNEVAAGSVTVRQRGKEEQETVPLAAFAARAAALVSSRSLSLELAR